MRENMAAVISSQLDFILFFYGLAFILLGSTCFALSREEGRGEPWAVLGLFGFMHGVGEWLDLSALVIGDTLAFTAMRNGLMAGSFIVLLEFARREAFRFGLKWAGGRLRWLYLALILLVPVGRFLGGLAAANALARYAIGFPAALAVSMVFIWHARHLSGISRYLAIFAAAAFALYAVAAGIIVPDAPFWPANTINYAWFVHLTGIPIQLIRGVLACAIALSIWAIWGHQLVVKVSSDRYTTYLRQQFVWSLAAMTAILLCGWVLTDFLGGIYKQNVQVEARGDIELLGSYLAGETAPVEGMVKALAGSPSVRSLLAEEVRKTRRGRNRCWILMWMLRMRSPGRYWIALEDSSLLPSLRMRPPARRMKAPLLIFRHRSRESQAINSYSMQGARNSIIMRAIRSATRLRLSSA